MKENLFPFPAPTDAEALADYAALQTLDTLPLRGEGEWFSRSVFDAPMHPFYIDSSKTGLLASNRHHWYARMACDSLNSPSPVRNWYQAKHRATLENSKFYADSPKTAMSLRKYVASQFRPSAALTLYRTTGARSVYDPCGGWGDRLIAAMAGGIRYHCRDTNPLVLAADAAMQRMYPHTEQVSFEYASAADPAPKEKFDLVFTSPPYWKAEKYQGEQSSYVTHKSFPAWRDGFLLPMVDSAWSCVRKGGTFALNISDMYGGHTYNRLVQPVLDYFGGNAYVIGYRLAKRVASQSMQTGVFCEPIIMVKK